MGDLTTHFRYGRDMLDDLSHCSLRASFVDGGDCLSRDQLQIDCPECPAAHYCSERCQENDATVGWHSLTHLRREALATTQVYHFPHLLALELRQYASQTALEIMLADTSDFTYLPMIPALLFQLCREEDALEFISREIQFPETSQDETYRLLLSYDDQKASGAQALHMAGSGEKGLAFAAVITLIKMCRHRDIINPPEEARRANGHTPERMDPELQPCSAMYLDTTPIASQKRVFAEEDLRNWHAAVAIQQPDFWSRLLRGVSALFNTRTTRLAPTPDYWETARRVARTSPPPQMNAVTWALPAWWAASAPLSKRAAQYLDEKMDFRAMS